jgi:uncharacterized protein YbaR (Trm112 family)
LFIELTDHLRCPADHDEAFLVLIPISIENRRVVTGHLGCPVCERSFPIVEGVALFGRSGSGGGATPAAEPIDAEALAAFLGLEGPGGYVLMVGDVGRHAAALSALLPGIHFAVLNGPDGLIESAEVSLLVAPSAPIKRRSMRGVVLGGDSKAVGWQSEAARVLLPGLRAVGQGSVAVPDLETLASADGWWVARRSAN